MNGIQYKQTAKGLKTRSQLLEYIQPDEELTRDEWARRAGLTYEQVRRQTKNLVNIGKLQSRLENGQRFYSLSRNFKPIIGTFLIAVLCGWSVPVEHLNSGIDHEENPPTAEGNRSVF